MSKNWSLFLEWKVNGAITNAYVSDGSWKLLDSVFIVYVWRKKFHIEPNLTTYVYFNIANIKLVFFDTLSLCKNRAYDSPYPFELSNNGRPAVCQFSWIFENSRRGRNKQWCARTGKQRLMQGKLWNSCVFVQIWLKGLLNSSVQAINPRGKTSVRNLRYRLRKRG